MALIKSSRSGPLVKGASVFDLSELTRETEQLRRVAEQQAHEIMHRAKVESKKLIDSATDRGFAEGNEKGLAEGRAEGHQAGREEAIAEFAPQLQELQTAFVAVVERWETELNSMLLAAREDVLEFALAMAEKVTHRVVQADTSVIGDQLAEALKLLVAPRAITITIAPQDRALVESMLPKLIEMIGTCTHATIRDDDSVTRGGCVLSTGAGRIDATIEIQIQRIVDTLLPQSVEKGPEDQLQGDEPPAEEEQS